MVDKKGDQPTKKQSQKSPQQQQQPQQQKQKSSSPKEEAASKEARHKQLVAPSLYVPFLGEATTNTTLTSSTTPFPTFEQLQFELAINPKRPRYGPTSATSAQWKLLPRQTQLAAPSDESSPSPTTHSQSQLHLQAHTTAASSSDTASSPPHSQKTTKPEADLNPSLHHPHHPQFRKGKYVSPVWKPYEMLWLARAWRIQYQGGGGGDVEATTPTTHQIITGSGGELQVVQPTRGKTRADKDREVAEFLSSHGVNRDAKTAGTKWDNMLGEFRKVYEWERGGEREQVGKSYFRLSPYERKMHRLPASFDEEVFEELSQFMGSRIRNPQVRPGEDSSKSLRALPLPPPSTSFKDDDPISLSGRTKQQLVTMSSIRGEGYFHGGGSSGRSGGLLGFEGAMDVNVVVVGGGGGGGGSKELRRVGKIRMTWEESVNLWAEEGDHHRGRIRLQGSGFLNADELTYFDDSMVACTMEAFEDGPLKGFSVDKFVSGQQVKVFGRRKSSSSSTPPPAPTSSAPPGSSIERIQLPLTEHSTRSIPPWEYQDPTEYYVGCLKVPPTTLPSLFELSWYLQEPPPEELRFPLRKDVYRDLPQGKELFFTTSTELLDCRGFVFDILSSIIRTNPSISSSSASSRDSFIGLWDDCINRIVRKFCSVEVVLVRKPPHNSSLADTTTSYQDQWPNVTGFVRNFCLWRGEEADQIREGQQEPWASLVEKLLWSYMDLPYILGYYAIGYTVTFCALSRSQDGIIRTDLYTLDLSSPSERIKALVPCYRVAGLLPLLADCCVNNSASYNKQHVITYSDFERVDMGNGNIMEMTPNTVTRFFSSKKKWAAVKEIHDLFDHRIPHAEFICHSLEKDLALVFKPRGVNYKPTSCHQLVEALKCVTKALVALHDLGFMHRDLSWDKVVMRMRDGEAETETETETETEEWFVCGFDEAACAPQLYSHVSGDARGRHAPEMGRGLHGVKVDVWGVGHLVKTCGLGASGVPKMLRELQNKCFDQNPEMRPTAADCYHHLLQVQSSLQSSSPGGAHY